MFLKLQRREISRVIAGVQSVRVHGDGTIHVIQYNNGLCKLYQRFIV